MDELHDRLRRVRTDRDLSLRRFAEALRERTGYEVSHSSVNKYESGHVPPADYLLSVSDAFSVDSAWLLEGEKAGDDPVEIRDLSEVRHRLEDLLASMSEGPETGGAGVAGSDEEWDTNWEAVSGGWDPDLSASPLVLRSHERSEAADVPRESGEAAERKVGEAELERRRTRSRSLLDAAQPHLRWFSGLLGDVPHVVYLTDADGIVLHAEGETRLVEEWRLTPGHDWSEGQMGTNGAGTALQAGRPVAVIGAEHYRDAFSDVTCLGAPIRGPEGTIQGAVDVTTPKQLGSPERLLPVVYVAWTIGRELDG